MGDLALTRTRRVRLIALEIVLVEGKGRERRRRRGEGEGGSGEGARGGDRRLIKTKDEKRTAFAGLTAQPRRTREGRPTPKTQTEVSRPRGRLGDDFENP